MGGGGNPNCRENFLSDKSVEVKLLFGPLERSTPSDRAQRNKCIRAAPPEAKKAGEQIGDRELVESIARLNGGMKRRAGVGDKDS